MTACAAAGCDHAHPCPNTDAIGGTRPLCTPCETRLGYAISRLPRWHAALRGELVPTRNPDAPKVSGSRTPPAPLHIERAAVVDDIERLAEQWAGLVAGVDPATAWLAREPLFGPSKPTRWTALPVVVASGGGPRGRRLHGNVTLLLWRTPVLLSLDPDVALGATAAVELLDVEAIARRALGVNRLRHYLPSPCPACDRRALVREDGSELVACGACRMVWPWDDYDRLVADMASGKVRRGA